MMNIIYLCVSIAFIGYQEMLEVQGKIQIIRSIIKAAKSLDRFSKGERAITSAFHGAS